LVWVKEMGAEQYVRRAPLEESRNWQVEDHGSFNFSAKGGLWVRSGL